MQTSLKNPKCQNIEFVYTYPICVFTSEIYKWAKVYKPQPP